MYIDKLDDVVKEYSNTYHITIKMKPTDVYSSTYVDCGIKNIENDPEFKVGDHLRISKYINIFAKVYAPKFLWLKSHKYCTMVIPRKRWNVPRKGQGKDKPKRIQKSKSIKYISNEKAMIIHLIVILISNTVI